MEHTTPIEETLETYQKIIESSPLPVQKQYELAYVLWEWLEKGRSIKSFPKEIEKYHNKIITKSNIPNAFLPEEHLFETMIKQFRKSYEVLIDATQSLIDQIEEGIDENHLVYYKKQRINWVQAKAKIIKSLRSTISTIITYIEWLEDATPTSLEEPGYSYVNWTRWRSTFSIMKKLHNHTRYLNQSISISKEKDLEEAKKLKTANILNQDHYYNTTHHRATHKLEATKFSVIKELEKINQLRSNWYLAGNRRNPKYIESIQSELTMMHKSIDHFRKGINENFSLEAKEEPKNS